MKSLLIFLLVCLLLLCAGARRWIPPQVTASSPPAYGSENTRSTETSSGSTTTVAVAGAGISAGVEAVLIFNWDTSSQTVGLVGGSGSSTDSAGNTWTLDKQYITVSDNFPSAIAHSFLTHALTSSDTIIINWTSASFTNRAWVLVSCTNTTAVDVTAGTTGGFSTSVTNPSITTSAAKTIIFATVCGTFSGMGTYTSPTFTKIGALSHTGTPGAWYMYKIQSTAATVNPGGTMGSSDDYGGCAVSFK